jgi:hypothetical protein
MKIFIIALLHYYLLTFSQAATSTRQLIEGVPPLLFQGKLVNDLQDPISNARIQFWQTDPDGTYNHPNADGSNSLYSTFQYFGTATTLDDGTFWFLTHRPGIYTGRPTHFHYKVWVDGQEMLTSQFYFADEKTSYPDMQVILLQEHEFDTGLLGFVTNKTIVLDMNLGGNGPFTPSDMEGPFYPVFDFFSYGNDLINAAMISSDGSVTGAPTSTPSEKPTDLTDAPSLQSSNISKIHATTTPSLPSIHPSILTHTNATSLMDAMYSINTTSPTFSSESVEESDTKNSSTSPNIISIVTLYLVSLAMLDAWSLTVSQL